MRLADKQRIRREASDFLAGRPSALLLSDIPPEQCEVLGVLRDGRWHYAEALAERLGLTSKEAAGACRRLRDRGLVHCIESDPFAWSITPAGLALATRRAA